MFGYSTRTLLVLPRTPVPAMPIVPYASLPYVYHDVAINPSAGMLVAALPSLCPT